MILLKRIVSFPGMLLNDVHGFDTATSSWTMYSSNGYQGAPASRMAPGLGTLDGMIYIFGGQTIAGKFVTTLTFKLQVLSGELRGL